MLTIEVKVNERVVAKATARNLTDLADVSDYYVTADEVGMPRMGIASFATAFSIDQHPRRQSAWALVALIAAHVAENACV